MLKIQTRKEKNSLIKIIVTAVIFAVIFIIDLIYPLESITGGKYGWLLPFFIYLAIYIFIGSNLIKKGFFDILNLQFFSENVLMLIATLGAMALGIYSAIIGNEINGFDEACVVAIFFETGNFFESVATNSARKNIKELMDIRPDIANVKRNDNIIKIPPEELNLNETIVVYPGEKIPIDGIVTSGSSIIDNKALTGESLPVEVQKGSEILSGGINLTSPIEIKVEKTFYNSTATKILELVENASDKKSKAENFITVFAEFYTPIVIIAAILTMLIPIFIKDDFQKWIYRALNFLVVSCPCALVISVPLAFFVAIGKASDKGILIKGSNYLEALAKANILVFDKTGTLTSGNMKITSVYPIEKKDDILSLAAICEETSPHPIAKLILSEYGKKPLSEGYTATNFAGLGIIAENKGDKIFCGNNKLMQKYNIDYPVVNAGTVVYIAKNNDFLGYITIADKVRDEAENAMQELLRQNCKISMLTGDNEEAAESVAKSLNIKDFYYSLLPQDKLKKLDKIIEQKEKKDAVCFVGDGINDAPSLIRADIGVAMGKIGSDASLEAADIILMQDNLNSLPIAKRLAKSTLRIVKENIALTLSIKLLIIILSFLGLTNMWISIFGDVGVAIIAILNAIRIGKFK